MSAEHDTTLDMIGTDDPLPGEDNTPHPGLPGRERRVRQCGSWARAAGITLLTGTPLVVTTIPEHQVSHVALLVSSTLIGAGLATGGALLGAGMVEKMTQYGRAQGRRAILRQQRNQEQLEAIGHAIDQIADQLPDALQKAHWGGYRAAVTEEVATGGGYAPRPAISLVRPDDVAP